MAERHIQDILQEIANDLRATISNAPNHEKHGPKLSLMCGRQRLAEHA